MIQHANTSVMLATNYGYIKGLQILSREKSCRPDNS